MPARLAEKSGAGRAWRTRTLGCESMCFLLISSALPVRIRQSDAAAKGLPGPCRSSMERPAIRKRGSPQSLSSGGALGRPAGFVRATPVTFSGGFGQANYWVYPWVIALMRYDVVNSSPDFLSGLSRHQTRNRTSPGVQFLVRANIKLAFEYQHEWELPIPDSTQFFRPNGFQTGIDFVF